MRQIISLTGIPVAAAFMLSISFFYSCAPGPTDEVNAKLTGKWKWDSVYGTKKNYPIVANHTFLFNEDNSHEAYDWNLDITCTGQFVTEIRPNKGQFKLSLVPDENCPDDCGSISLLIEKVDVNRLVLIDSAYPEYNSTIKEPVRRIYKRIK